MATPVFRKYSGQVVLSTEIVKAKLFTHLRLFLKCVWGGGGGGRDADFLSFNSL